MIASIIFVARDNSVDDPRHVFLVAIYHKGGCNNKSDKFHTNDLNEMSSPKNKFKLNCKNGNKCVTASVLFITITIDQIERIPFTNHSRENILFGSIYSDSFHVNDVKDKLPS